MPRREQPKKAHVIRKSTKHASGSSSSSSTKGPKAARGRPSGPKKAAKALFEEKVDRLGERVKEMLRRRESADVMLEDLRKRIEQFYQQAHGPQQPQAPDGGMGHAGTGGDPKVSAAMLVSGKVGVTWCRAEGAWRADMKWKKARVQRQFKPKDLSRKAVAAARVKAERAREQWERKRGRPGDGRRATKTSGGVPGVTWDGRNGSGCWRVQLKRRGKQRRRSFRPEDPSPASIEVARLRAVEFMECLRAAQ